MSRFLFSRKAPRSIISGLPRDQREFYEHLGEDADVRLEPGYHQDEIFDDQFERRAHEKTRTPSSNNAVTVIPSMQGPWTGNNNLGIERLFSPDLNNEQTILKMPEWGFPEMWTVCLGINDFSFTPNPDPIAFDVTALIQFGVGGAMQEVEIDWLNGTAISLPMNAVNVVARFAAGSGEGSTSIPDDLRLRVTLSRGRSHFARPTRTIVFEEAQTSIAIPKFAKNVFVATGLSLPGITPFNFYSSGNYVELSPVANSAALVTLPVLTSQFVSSIDFTNELLGSPQKVPVPPYARFLNTRNAAGAVAVINASYAQFEIGI